jgi:hypothetical protein
MVKKMKKYGAIVEMQVEVGDELPGGMVEIHVPIKTPLLGGKYTWRTIPVSKRYVSNNKISLIIVNRNFDDDHTSLLCPDMQTIIAVHDSIIKIPFWKNMKHRLCGKRIKIDEV